MRTATARQHQRRHADRPEPDDQYAVAARDIAAQDALISRANAAGDEAAILEAQTVRQMHEVALVRHQKGSVTTVALPAIRRPARKGSVQEIWKPLRQARQKPQPEM